MLFVSKYTHNHLYRVYSNSIGELSSVAVKLNLRNFQDKINPFYSITASQRDFLIKGGAKVKTYKEIVQMTPILVQVDTRYLPTPDKPF